MERPDAARQAALNQLFAALPPGQRDSLVALLEPVSLRQGEILYNTDDVVDRIFFPTDCVVSMVTEMQDGGSVEAMLIGNDGIVGDWLAAGVDRSPWHCVVQLSGDALVLDVSIFLEHLRVNSTLRALVLRHAIAEHYLTSQSVGCNRFHDLTARAARWLLMTRDRTHSDDLPLTHEFLAQMLGVYRPSVTVALGALERAGTISRARRGVIRIVDRALLEDSACECYARVRDYMHTIVQTDAE